MKLHGMLLLGNDMIIPRDPRDLGTAWINETQVTMTKKGLIAKDRLSNINLQIFNSRTPLFGR